MADVYPLKYVLSGSDTVGVSEFVSTDVLPTDVGGTGLTASGTSGNALISNGTIWTSASMVDDASTTSTVKGWSASKLNTTLGDISSALAAIIG